MAISIEDYCAHAAAELALDTQLTSVLAARERAVTLIGLATRQDDRAAIRHAAMLRVRAERRIGELLATSNGVARELLLPAQRRRWQKLAAMAASDFELKLSAARGRGITANAIAPDRSARPTSGGRGPKAAPFRKPPPGVALASLIGSVDGFAAAFDFTTADRALVVRTLTRAIRTLNRLRKQLTTQSGGHTP